MKKHVFYFNFLKKQAIKTMKIWLAVLAMGCAVGVQGQGWLKTFDYNSSVVTSIAPTADGGLFALVSGRKLLKVDGYGTLLFEKNWDTLWPNIIVPTPDGNFAMTSAEYHIINDNIPDNDSVYVSLTKINPNGDLIWSKRKLVSVYQTYVVINSIVPAPDGGFRLAGVLGEGEMQSTLTLKADELGNLEVLNFQINGGYDSAEDMVLNPNGDYLIAGNVNNLFTSGTTGPYLLKFNADDDNLWEKTYDDGWFCNSLVNAANGGYLVAGKAQNNNIEDVPFCIKVDDNGNEIWQKKWIDIRGAIYDVIAAQGGGYYLFGNTGLGLLGNTPDNLLLIKIDENGNELWRNIFGTTALESGEQLFQTQSGSIFICANAHTLGAGNEVLLAKMDSLGNIYSSAISGFVRFDPASDCQIDTAESGLAGWLVQAAGVQSLATLTDANGHYFLSVDTGSYELEIVPPPGPYWELCNSPESVSITAFYDTLTVDFAAQAISDCPYLTVDISAPFLRRCFENNYYVHYCNDGTVTAEDAAVEVTLDPNFTYISSSIPPASQNGTTLTFDIGDVAVNDCGSFQITALLSCDSTILGQTHCTAAHISPDSLCPPLPDPLWNGSSIETDVTCNGDSVTFTITNVGTGDMPAPLGYIIIEDEIVLMSDEFQLPSGQSITVTLPANGSTLHLEAQQAAAHPSGFASTGATIEGCGGWLSIGFFTQWAFDDDPDPFTDVDCQANIGAYDPNDKQGFPAGLGDEHLIEPGQDLEYLIRFQNTGTDTAFKVTIVDVLPPELDLASVRPGASSHPYTYGVTPEGWLTFTFENIMLPDSNVNEPASHGFVRFRASQVPDLGHGDYIENTALIYFDFNAPVQTNTYRHRIGQVNPWTVVGTTPPVFQAKKQVRIVPNPLTDSALLQVEGIEPGPLNLVLTDVSGKVLRQQTTQGTGFEFQRGELAPGVYFFQIARNGEWVASGKLMVR